MTNLTADNLPPVLDSATVHSNLLLLGYRESTALDAEHAPQREAFALLANGSAMVITAVAVDAAANTVARTLTRAVGAGQTVSLSYTDPGNTQSIQDTAANHAASFSALRVDNRTASGSALALGIALRLPAGASALTAQQPASQRRLSFQPAGAGVRRQ